jgi:Protein of unknown function (DUF2911)
VKSFARMTVAALIMTACQARAPMEQYGFVATLGNDTVSVERVSRSARRLVSDEVDRWPLVQMRHTEFDLTDDGKLARMVMDVRTPSGETPAQRGRRVTAAFTKDSVMITITDSSGVTRRNFRTGGALTVPHVSMMYSVIELEIASSLHHGTAPTLAVGDSSPFRQFYPDRNVGPGFVLHSGWVHRGSADSVVLRHDWLSGSGDVTVDSMGRMRTYSGVRSTYKVDVIRVSVLPDVDAIGARLAAAEKRSGPSQLSVRDTVRGTIGTSLLSVDYGRPLARGRTLLGNVIAYDHVWRTGANAATQFTTSAPITLAGIVLPAGTYTLWTVPRTAGADLIVNAESGQWGTEYNGAKDVGFAPMRTETLSTPVEKFTISIAPIDAKHGTLVIEWGTFRWSAAIISK